MPRSLFALALLLSVAADAQPAGSPEPAGKPPGAQESILPAHDVGVSFGLGFELTPSGYGTTITNGVLRLNVAWAPLDWLEVSFLLPGVGVLLGTRHADEVLLSAGLDGIGYGSVEGLIVVPSADAAYRHWFSSETSLGASARWSSRYSQIPPQHQLTGSVFITHTFGKVVSLNFAVGGTRWWPSHWSGLILGSGRLGFRSLPLFRVHLSPGWTIDLDAQLTLWLHPETRTEQQYLLGFTAIW